MKSYISVFTKLVVLVVLSVLFSACVKDVDLDQKEDIVLSPEIDVDLVIYSLDEMDFQDPTAGALQTFISDTVRLEFLDDDYIQGDLTSVEFYFRHINTFPREIESKIRFLSNSNQEQFSVNYTISAGGSGNPVIADTTELIETARIGEVRRTIKMVVELEVQPGGAAFEGELNFASKGLFWFDFK